MKDIKFICLCEDVTEEDIVKAIKAGFDDIFSLRMFTGAGTGSCQGKYCAINLVKLLAKYTKKNIDEVGLPSFRTPLKPVPVEKVVGEEE